MKKLFSVTLFAFGLCCVGILGADQPKEPRLNFLQLREVPPGVYEVTLQYEGQGEKVKVRLSIKNNQVTLVESSSKKFDGLVGRFMLIGKGVFRAQLRFRAGTASQYWIFHPDGSATVKEIPDRGEKQTARRVAKE
jgi:hypothetical protein